MSKPSPFPLEQNLFYPLILERERELRSNYLPDVLRELNFKPRQLVMEQTRVTFPLGLGSFSRTRIVIDE